MCDKFIIIRLKDIMNGFYVVWIRLLARILDRLGWKFCWYHEKKEWIESLVGSAFEFDERIKHVISVIAVKSDDSFLQIAFFV